jgi:hypothetical protein
VYFLAFIFLLLSYNINGGTLQDIAVMEII